MKTISVGRASDNDIIIQDALVSSKHLLLSLDEAGKFWVEDLNSTNGTWVGKELLRGGRQALNPETLIKIGDTLIVWQNYFLETETEEVEKTETEEAKEVKEINPLPAPPPQSSIIPILRWTALGMGAFFVFLLLFWYFNYVKRP